LAEATPLGELLPPSEFDRGSFLTFRRPDAQEVYQRLHDRGVITDYRGDRLRIGFGIYHQPSDVARLLSLL
jgi:kynureninase